MTPAESSNPFATLTRGLTRVCRNGVSVWTRWSTGDDIQYQGIILGIMDSGRKKMLKILKCLAFSIIISTINVPKRASIPQLFLFKLNIITYTWITLYSRFAVQTADIIIVFRSRQSCSPHFQDFSIKSWLNRSLLSGNRKIRREGKAKKKWLKTLIQHLFQWF